jgi:uncharacterized RDD family membrane protein YckC
MLPENLSFLIRGDDGAEYGPVDLEELREWVRENRAGLGTEVRLDEPGSQWNPWQSHPELVALLAEVHASNPLPELPGMVIAPIWRRMVAFALDLVLISILVTPILITLALVFLPDWFTQYVVATSQPPFIAPDVPLNGKVVANLISDVVMALYFTGFHAAHGKTPAKALLRLRVVEQSGQNPSLAKAFIRAFVLIVSMSLLFIPFIYAFLNPQRRALHDLVADTCVVEA